MIYLIQKEGMAMKNKVAIYTATTEQTIFNEQPSILAAQCDYICFAEDPAIQSSIWQMRSFPNTGLDADRKITHVKLLPHLLLPEYDYTIWIENPTDSVLNSLHQWIEKELFKDTFNFYALKHTEAYSAYDMAMSAIKHQTDRIETITLQMQSYQNQYYPSSCGISDTSVLFRKNHSPEVAQLMERWWEEITTFSFLDSLSFNYVLWKNNFNISYLVTEQQLVSTIEDTDQENVVS